MWRCITVAAFSPGREALAAENMENLCFTWNRHFALRIVDDA
jgi:hypothetical protein